MIITCGVDIGFNSTAFHVLAGQKFILTTLCAVEFKELKIWDIGKKIQQIVDLMSPNLFLLESCGHGRIASEWLQKEYPDLPLATVDFSRKPLPNCIPWHLPKMEQAANYRSLAYHFLSELFRYGKLKLLREDLELTQELLSLSYEEDHKGRVFIKAKKGQTPKAQALALACFAYGSIEQQQKIEAEEAAA